MIDNALGDDNRITNYVNNRFTQLNNNEDFDDPLHFNDNLKEVDSKGKKDKTLKILEYKVILLGDYNVGKTSIIKRFVNNTFETDVQSTISSSLSTKKIRIDDHTLVNLNIWDTAGEEKLNPIIKNYFNDARGALIVYDVGNKSDISDKKINYDDGKKLADDYKINFLEVSAKTGNNIAIAFERLCNIIIQRENEGGIEERKTIRINSQLHHTKNSKCCLFKK